ncbi:PID-CTERM protein-sorting domain-containing protein [Gracilimonas sp. BCB1]|uniref:PID-CTERM protein-sorting domain-containing protein n=1 Tax=Gracilimonas sp. BCB1 TaxID=3152362 RepID=UPI0032D98AE0
MKSLIYFSLAIVFTLLFTTVLFAQPSAPMNPTQAPIDGGLSLLAAAGGGYAIKKLRDRKKRLMKEEQKF